MNICNSSLWEGWQLEWYILFYVESLKSSSFFFFRNCRFDEFVSTKFIIRREWDISACSIQYHQTRNHPKQDIKSKFCFDHASIVIREGFSRKECTCNIWYVDINNLRIDSSSWRSLLPWVRKEYMHVVIRRLAQAITRCLCVFEELYNNAVTYAKIEHSPLHYQIQSWSPMLLLITHEEGALEQLVGLSASRALQFFRYRLAMSFLDCKLCWRD